MEDVVEYRNLLLQALRDIRSGELVVGTYTRSTYTGPEEWPSKTKLEAEIRAELVRLAKENMNYFYAKKSSVEASGPNGGPIPIETITRKVVDPKADADESS